jgi:hypothetical protein
MTIALIARDLYRLIRQVEALERQLPQTPPLERPALEERLRVLRAERDQMRRILEGSKQEPLERR